MKGKANLRAGAARGDCVTQNFRIHALVVDQSPHEHHAGALADAEPVHRGCDLVGQEGRRGAKNVRRHRISVRGGGEHQRREGRYVQSTPVDGGNKGLTGLPAEFRLERGAQGPGSRHAVKIARHRLQGLESQEISAPFVPERAPPTTDAAQVPGRALRDDDRTCPCDDDNAGASAKSPLQRDPRVCLDSRRDGRMPQRGELRVHGRGERLPFLSGSRSGEAKDGAPYLRRRTSGIPAALQHQVRQVLCRLRRPDDVLVRRTGLRARELFPRSSGEDSECFRSPPVRPEHEPV